MGNWAPGPDNGDVTFNMSWVSEESPSIARPVTNYSCVHKPHRYICQYIEVKKADTIAAARWLGIQAGLALLRIIIWVWDPEFDDYGHNDLIPESANTEGLEPVGLPWYFTLLELSLFEGRQAKSKWRYSWRYSWWYSGRYSVLSLPPIDNHHNLFRNALDVFTPGHLQDDIVGHLLEGPIQAWILKPPVFAKWMELLSGRKFTTDSGHELTAMIVDLGQRALDPPKQSLHNASDVAIDIEPNPELSSERPEVDCPKPHEISGQGVVLIPLLIYKRDVVTFSYVIPISAGPNSKPFSTFIKSNSISKGQP